MIHHKKYFPQEPGFFEEAWYVCGAGKFDCVQVGQVKVGVLLCTELFFNDRARAECHWRDGKRRAPWRPLRQVRGSSVRTGMVRASSANSLEEPDSWSRSILTRPARRKPNTLVM